MTPRDSNQYRFVTNWTVEATPEEVFEILQDAERLPAWWPSVYRSVRTVPLEDGSKKRLLETQGWLPYRLRWEARVVEHEPPRLLGIRASGDFEGRGLWTLGEIGTSTRVRYEWSVRAEKPLLRRLSFALKPLFAWNHRWAMERGRESLELELRRRRGLEAGPPRGPVSMLRSGLIVLGGLLLIALLGALGAGVVLRLGPLATFD
jgi:uncharacterized protein YndB with AHSA1/START domain